MKVVICLDEKNGFSYNKRRQSRDKVLRNHLAEKLNGESLNLNSYSARTFINEESWIDGFHKLVVKEKHLFDTNEWFLCENYDIAANLNKVNEMIIYRWNRLYVSDLSLPMDFDKDFEIIESEDFKGSSHTKITYQRLVRKVK